MEGKISYSQLYNFIINEKQNKSNAKIIIKDKKCYFEESILCDNLLSDVIFENCNFYYAKVKNILINNCDFINCVFFDVKVSNCTLNNITFTNCSLINNTFISNNVFNYLKGENVICNCVGVVGNYFKNTDFSGCEGIYYRSRGNYIEWSENYFINSTIDLNSIIRLLNCNAKYILHIHPYVDKPVKRDLLPGISQNIGHGIMGIDLTDLSEECKLNIIASLFTHFSEEEIININEDYNYLPIEKDKYVKKEKIKGMIIDIDKRSKVYFRTKNNPLPIVIVDEMGNQLKPDVTKAINIESPLLCDCKYFYSPMTVVKGILLEDVYTSENNLLDSNNYFQNKLVPVIKKLR